MLLFVFLWEGKTGTDAVTTFSVCWDSLTEGHQEEPKQQVSVAAVELQIGSNRVQLQNFGFTASE